MSNSELQIENADLSNFDPSLLEKGQEITFTLKDKNILDNDENNSKENFQMEDINYSKDTGIVIDRYNENTLLEVNKDKKDLITKEDNQILDEDFLIKKFSKIKEKIENKGQNLSKKKKFQEEFYNEEELKLLNKKKNRKKRSAMALFDIDINEENSKKESNEDSKEENNNKKNEYIKKDENKKTIFTEEDKQQLENLFGFTKKNNGAKPKKNIVNIDENLIEEKGDNDNNNNILNNTNKNYKIIDDYALFLDNLPNPKNKEEPKEEINKIENENIQENNNKSNLEDNGKIEEKEKIEEEGNDDEFTFNKDDDIPLIEDEPIVGKGVCVALQIFKNKKMLREEEFGRYHDKKYENITNKVNEENATEYDNNTLNIKDKNEYYRHKEINIEYRDENGRKLRPKEMARYQALIFHGSTSSVRKREKKLLREKYQVFVQNPSNNKTLNYMNFMKDKNHQAFATLQGKSSFL